MEFFIDKTYFGTPFYLKISDTGEVSKLPSAPPQGSIVVGTLEAWALSKLYGFSIPRFPPVKYRRPFSEMKGVDVNKVPWDKAMPRHAYKAEVKSKVNYLKQVFSQLDNLSYYRKCFKAHDPLFKDLKPSKINVPAFMNLLVSSKGENNGILRTFVPTSGYAQAPVYDRIGSRTGRLTIKRGPNILNLKKEFRKIIESRFKGGSIYQLDFSSLEPRVLLAINGNRNIPQDIYTSVIDELELEDVPRQAIKQAVISRLYGAADYTIEKQLKQYVDYPADILEIVDEHFGIDKLRQKLSQELSDSSGRLVNSFYGRHIMCEDVAPYVLLNYFIQSTAVDVALFGFNKVNAEINKNNNSFPVVPLFVLHDALFLDVHPDAEAFVEQRLCEVGSNGIPGFEGTNFHLQASKEV